MVSRSGTLLLNVASAVNLGSGSRGTRYNYIFVSRVWELWKWSASRQGRLTPGGQRTVSTIWKWVAGQMVAKIQFILLEIEPNSSNQQSLMTNLSKYLQCHTKINPLYACVDKYIRATICLKRSLHGNQCGLWRLRGHSWFRPKVVMLTLGKMYTQFLAKLEFANPFNSWILSTHLKFPFVPHRKHITSLLQSSIG
jgi:hypothetical protein